MFKFTTSLKVVQLLMCQLLIFFDFLNYGSNINLPYNSMVSSAVFIQCLMIKTLFLQHSSIYLSPSLVVVLS